MPNKPHPSHLIWGRTSGNINVPVLVDATGAVQIGGAGSGGTSSTFGAAFPSAGSAIGFKDSTGALMSPGNLDGAGSLKVAITSGGGSGVSPATATLANVTAASTSATALASNANRVGAVFHNDADAAVYLKFGATASLTSYTIKILSQEHYELPRAPYTGKIDAIWDANVSTGALRVTELTA